MIREESGARRWLIIGIVVAEIATAAALAWAWVALGGFPHAHDKYGSIPVPGRQVIELPGETVRVNFENDSTGGENASVEDRPSGLALRITPEAGGEELPVDEVPSWIFGAVSDDRGHEPYGNIEPAEAGSYLVETGDSGTPLPQAPAAAPQTPATDNGPEITLGAKPWTPLGSVALGATLVAVLVLTVSGGITFLVFRLTRSSPDPAQT